jgi:hypothetical protein
VACALHTPPQVRFRVNRLQVAVREDDVHGNELIRDKAMMTLKPTVAASKTRSQEADTFTGSRNYWVLRRLIVTKS